MKHWAIGLCLAAFWLGCGGGDDGTVQSGPTMPKLEPVALYEDCSGGAGCVESKCIGFEEPLAKLCSVKCESDDDCTRPSSEGGGVTCDDGHCRPYVCTTAQHLQSLGNGLICIRGEVMACDELEERPCACGCGDAGRCGGTGVCVPKIAIGEACTSNESCATGFCATDSFGANGVCKKGAGEACSANAFDCGATCAAPLDGTPGYCLVGCITYCGSSGCGERCEDPDFTCIETRICRRKCSADEECEGWEICEFASIVDQIGICVTDPNGPTVPIAGSAAPGGTGGAGGNEGFAGSTGIAGSSETAGSTGTAGTGVPGAGELGDDCTSDGECNSGTCAETFPNAPKRCAVAPGSECFDHQDLCAYTLDDGHRSVCFSNSFWSICALNCDPDTMPCSGTSVCAELFNSDAARPPCSSSQGLWCMPSCTLDSDCGDTALWTCIGGLCEPDGLSVQDPVLHDCE